jgi:hypothetical protein
MSLLIVQSSQKEFPKKNGYAFNREELLYFFVASNSLVILFPFEMLDWTDYCQDRGDAKVKFVSIVCGSANSQIDLLSREDQIGIVGVEIIDRVGFVPTQVFAFLY